MITSLHESGINSIEVGSFVHPRRVPNMADSEDVYLGVADLKCKLGVLVPNERGLRRAQSVGATKFNIPKEDIRVYVSHAFGCPIEGKADPDYLLDTLTKSALLGDDVVLCDTVGMADAEDMKSVLELTEDVRANWSLHLHHNYQVHDKILNNVQIGYDYGITQFDSSIGGLGGCPFSPGSGANLATEALVGWADKNNLDTGVSIESLQTSLDFVEKNCKIV